MDEPSDWLRIENQAVQTSSPEQGPLVVVEDNSEAFGKPDESDSSGLEDHDLPDNRDKPSVTPIRPDKRIRRLRRTAAGRSKEKEGSRRGRKLRPGMDRPYHCPVGTLSSFSACFVHRHLECWLHQGSLFPLSQPFLTTRKEYRNPNGLAYHLRKGRCVISESSTIDSQDPPPEDKQHESDQLQAQDAHVGQK